MRLCGVSLSRQTAQEQAAKTMTGLANGTNCKILAHGIDYIGSVSFCNHRFVRFLGFFSGTWMLR
jgi:hypothetical protein